MPSDSGARTALALIYPNSVRADAADLHRSSLPRTMSGGGRPRSAHRGGSGRVLGTWLFKTMGRFSGGGDSARSLSTSRANHIACEPSSNLRQYVYRRRSAVLERLKITAGAAQRGS